VEQLKVIPGSRYRAHWVGGPQFQNWTKEHDILSDLYDMVLTNVAALGGARVPEKALYPRPIVATATFAPKTVAEFDVGHFMRQIAS
jgi:hypothetical protein